MAWFYLFVAGILEIGWAVGLKKSEGFSRLLPSVITVILMIASVAVLALAVRKLPLGTAYAIWTGIGAVGASIAGIVLFAESKEWPKLLCLTLIVVGIIGLKIVSAPAPD
jgi:quaternary ammonium compound-resistance protein SugE